jgi:hypothetical protein
VLVHEAVEHARVHDPTASFIRVVDGGELEEDENVVRVVDAAEDTLHLRVLSRLRAILADNVFHVS